MDSRLSPAPDSQTVAYLGGMLWLLAGGGMAVALLRVLSAELLRSLLEVFVPLVRLVSR